jgi:DNA-directed RNA polymerase specialized sigma54-like protein
VIGTLASVEEMTSAQVAKAIGLSTSTVLRIDQDRLPHSITPGGHRRYRRQDVVRYAASLGRTAKFDDQQGEASDAE